MARLLLVCCLLLATSRTSATSSGNQVNVCSAYANFGCSKWNNGDRLDCIDPNKGIMAWAARAVYTDIYTLRSGDSGAVATDPTSYVPGRILNVYLKVHSYDWKYRGLLLHAVNAKNATVGSWELPASSNALFWTPPTCPNTVMHTSAGLKPFLVTLRFKAPAAGTGTISFRALIKNGPANTGAFFYPNAATGDLTLAEAAASPPATAGSLTGGATSASGGSGAGTPSTWLVSKVGQSCEQVCAGQRMTCDASAMAAVTSPAALQAAVGGQTACALPMLSDCSSVSPTMAGDGTCYYRSASCAAAPPVAVDCASTGTTTANGQRFCACAAGGARSSGSRDRPSAFLLAASLLLGARALGGAGTGGVGTGGSVALSATAVAGLLLAMSSGAQAHNWVLTPARAASQASTLRPCRGRTASDTHAQVGPGQSVVVKWATGHGRNVYWTVIHEDNVDWMRRANFTAMVEDYVALAPASANTAQTATYQRYHGTAKFGTAASFYTGGGGGLYESEVMPGDPNYLDPPPTPTVSLFKYTPAKIAGDRRVEYRSAKYPWLEGAAIYKQLKHLPNDYDAIRITIPPFSKPGHYVVGWRWGGYYDCMDVDKLAVPVTHRWGVDNGNFLYQKVDHCQFAGPRDVRTPCRLTTGRDAGQCLKELNAATRRNKKNDLLQIGVGVVPLSTPQTAMFRNHVAIPWGNATCAAGGLVSLTGTVTRQAVAWAGWVASTTTTAGSRCTSFTTLANAPLRDAVAACTASTCPGISWQGDSASSDPTTAGEAPFNWRICKSSAVEAAAGWTQYSKKAPAPIPAISGAPFTANVNFQPASASLTLPAGMVADTGALYGARGNGLTYGWSCAGVPLGSSGKSAPVPDTTHISSLSSCPGDAAQLQTWRLAVPNGVYDVNLRVGKSGGAQLARGCSVNNVRMTAATKVFGVTPLSNRVQVTHGHILLQGTVPQPQFARPSAVGNACNMVLSIQVTQVATAAQPAWMPASGNPWWQQRLPRPEPVGLVTVNLPGVTTQKYSCRSWWLFKGIACDDTITNPPFTQAVARELGTFNLAGATNQGAVVRVSNTSCSGGATCPGVVCSTVTKVQLCQVNSGNLCPVQVDCHGVWGRHVSVQLPGSSRILDVDSVDVHRSVPAPEVVAAAGGANATVCYGVEARTQTKTIPMFDVSLDPLDPVFYSTCYVRSKNVTWLPTATATRPPPRWRFNGYCLGCNNFKTNVLDAPASPYPIPLWEVNSTSCEDCNRLVGTSSALATEGYGAGAWGIGRATATATGGGGGGGGGGRGSAGIVIAIAAGGTLLVAAVVVAFVRTRSRAPKRGHHAFDNSSATATASPVQEMAAVAAPASSSSEWRVEVDGASGDRYYYNTRTQQTQWEKPAGFLG